MFLCLVQRSLRWFSIGLPYLTYDNACNEDKLATSREPSLFADTVLCVDPWHKEGHTCGDMYNHAVSS
jgi:hypothetical protein